MQNRLLTLSAIQMAVMSVILLFSYDASIAAEFTKGDNPDCRIQMRGQIIKGDLDRFKQVDAKLPISHRGDTTEASTICLDSPGGSLAEAGRLAAHFYTKGVGTVVHDGQECLSACSFMFMLGMAQGEEVAFVNRKLHPNAKLGFHRPEISLDETKDYKGTAVVKAFNIAILSTMDLLQISNSKKPFSQNPMIDVDLLKAVFDHRGSDFFYIDTIDKVGRWQIKILNLDPELLPVLNIEGAWNSCENQFRWQADITDNFTPFVLNPENTHRTPKIFSGKQGEVVFDVVGSNDGLVAAGCILKREYESILSCGFDDYRGTGLGEGGCDRSNHNEKQGDQFNSLLSMFHPETKISTLTTYVSSAQQVEDNLQAFYKRYDAAQNNQNEATPTDQAAPIENVEQGAKSWQMYTGFDLKGGDIYVERGVTSQDCLSICQGDGNCSAATYDRWNKICILKDINRSSKLMLLQPKTDTFMLGEMPQNNVQASQSRVVFKRRNDRNFPAPNNAYNSFQAADGNTCENSCSGDVQCHAYSYDNPRAQCSLYNLPGEYFPKRSSLIGIKEQLD